MKQEQKGEIILYPSDIGKIKIEVRLFNDTVWLTQKMMAELFQTTTQNITIHLKNIFEEGELQEDTTCKDFLQVQNEGSRTIGRKQKSNTKSFRQKLFHRLNMIIWKILKPCRKKLKRKVAKNEQNRFCVPNDR